MIDTNTICEYLPRVSKFVAIMTFQQCHIEFDNECDNESDKQRQSFFKNLFFHLDFYFFEYVLLKYIPKGQINWSLWL